MSEAPANIAELREQHAAVVAQLRQAASRVVIGVPQLCDTLAWVRHGQASPASDFLPIHEEHVLHFAMRYALGRRSTAPSIVADEIARLWPRIRPATQERMHREIREAIEAGHAGDACDIERWRGVLDLPL